MHPNGALQTVQLLCRSRYVQQGTADVATPHRYTRALLARVAAARHARTRNADATGTAAAQMPRADATDAIGTAGRSRGAPAAAAGHVNAPTAGAAMHVDGSCGTNPGTAKESLWGSTIAGQGAAAVAPSGAGAGMGATFGSGSGSGTLGEASAYNGGGLSATAGVTSTWWSVAARGGSGSGGRDAPGVEAAIAAAAAAAVAAGPDGPELDHAALAEVDILYKEVEGEVCAGCLGVPRGGVCRLAGGSQRRCVQARWGSQRSQKVHAGAHNPY